jgi:hypothetical protein
MSKKRSDREQLRDRWLRAQEISGGPFRISAINRHRQFALLHAAATARVTGSVDFARGALSLSKAARTEQWINRLSRLDRGAHQRQRYGCESPTSSSRSGDVPPEHEE